MFTLIDCFLTKKVKDFIDKRLKVPFPAYEDIFLTNTDFENQEEIKL